MKKRYRQSEKRMREFLLTCRDYAMFFRVANYTTYPTFGLPDNARYDPMLFFKFTPAMIDRAIQLINEEEYQGNIEFITTDHRQLVSTGEHRILGVLRCKSSRAYGSRYASTLIKLQTGDGFKPRATVSASWEAHKHFLWCLFAQLPEGRVKTTCADYRGVEDFVSKYPSTAGRLQHLTRPRSNSVPLKDCTEPAPKTSINPNQGLTMDDPALITAHQQSLILHPDLMGNMDNDEPRRITT